MKWRERLRRKRTRKGVQNLSHEAGDWGTCAVGERHKPLEEVGVTFQDGYVVGDAIVPDDDDVGTFGEHFANAVDDGDKTLALAILDELDTWIKTRRT